MFNQMKKELVNEINSDFNANKGNTIKINIYFILI